MARYLDRRGEIRAHSMASRERSHGNDHSPARSSHLRNGGGRDSWDDATELDLSQDLGPRPARESLEIVIGSGRRRSSSVSKVAKRWGIPFVAAVELMANFEVAQSGFENDQTGDSHSCSEERAACGVLTDTEAEPGAAPPLQRSQRSQGRSVRRHATAQQPRP